MFKVRYSYVYILMNPSNTVVYIGVTSNLVKRVWEHKNHMADGFTDKYNVTKLVLFEVFEDINEAIKREKQLKNWHSEWKINLIKKENPNFKDLYSEIV